MPGSGRGDIRASELVLPHFRVDAHPPGHKFMSELKQVQQDPSYDDEALFVSVKAGYLICSCREKWP